MTDSVDDTEPPLPSVPQDGLLTVEALQTDLDAVPPRPSVTLYGEAARNVHDSLQTATLEAVKAANNARKNVYELVPTEQAAQGLKDGTLRWATASSGDASVLIKNTETGKIAAHGKLKSVKPSPASVLGPAAWEAMAMATQQHYLVEINDKLTNIGRGVDRILATMDADKRGTLKHVESSVARARDRLADGHPPSPERRRELRDDVRDAERVWHQLHEQLAHQLHAYRSGDATATDVELAWEMLLSATRVLGQASLLLTTLPYNTVEELETATAEESARVLPAVEQVRDRAVELRDMHAYWSVRKAEYVLSHTRNPVKKATRTVRKASVARPAQEPLPDATAWRVGQLAAPPAPPRALLLATHDDGTVEVRVEH